MKFINFQDCLKNLKTFKTSDEQKKKLANVTTSIALVFFKANFSFLKLFLKSIEIFQQV